jgi:hypothetical protein
VDKVDAELGGDGREVGPVGGDDRDVGVELARLAPDEQVVEAVVELRDEDGEALAPPRVRDLPRHPEAPRDLVDPLLQDRGVPRPHEHVAVVERDPLVELALVERGELVAREQVAVHAVEELRERGDDALGVRALDEERREVRGGGRRGRRGGGGRGGGGRGGGAARRAGGGGGGGAGARAGRERGPRRSPGRLRRQRDGQRLAGGRGEARAGPGARCGPHAARVNWRV